MPIILQCDRCGKQQPVKLDDLLSMTGELDLPDGWWRGRDGQLFCNLHFEREVHTWTIEDRTPK